MGGNGKALTEGAHEPGQLPRAHAQKTGPTRRFPGHTCIDRTLKGIVPALIDMADSNHDGVVDELEVMEFLSPVPILDEGVRGTPEEA